MDEMKIRSVFMKKLIAKVIGKVMRKKTECQMDIWFNDISVTFDGDKAHVHLDADAEMSKDELVKLIRKAGL